MSQHENSSNTDGMLISSQSSLVGSVQPMMIEEKPCNNIVNTATVTKVTVYSKEFPAVKVIFEREPKE